MTDPPTAGILFISHHAVDRPYAVALEQLVHQVAGSRDRVAVRYSSSAELGPQGGKAWRQWIDEQVVAARSALIVVTPHALGKPWLLWEAGAVMGAALARAGAAGGAAQVAAAGGGGTAEAAASPIIASLAFGLPESECPDPLRDRQIVRGTDPDQLKRLLMRILQAHGMGGDGLFEAGERMRAAFASYAEAVGRAARRAPSVVNEANVQDWLQRLETIERERRLSELDGFERWMMLAFGRDPQEDAREGGIPVDVRLHRRLGELYLGQRRYAQAIRHLRLAWRAAPRDIFILRPLAEASMKQALDDRAAASGSAAAAAREEMGLLLTAIGELDDRAYTASPDSAALLAKYQRSVLDRPDEALRVIDSALACSPDSYYLLDLSAQLRLELRQPDAARQAFRRALATVERVGENSLWAMATAATACVALDDPDGARRWIERLRSAHRPNAAQLDSIATGLRKVASHLGLDPVAAEALMADAVPAATGVDAVSAVQVPRDAASTPEPPPSPPAAATG